MLEIRAQEQIIIATDGMTTSEMHSCPVRLALN